jgi:electron transport complex protein RnfC
MQEKVAGEPNIEVKVMKTKYPQGGERSLIYATTGRSINSSMLPADAGCIVHNVDTIYSIYLGVIEGKPLTKRIVTVTGDGVKNPGNFYVWLGMNYRQLLEAAGGVVGEPEKYISGGPMMGFAMYSLDVPVVKGSSSLLVFKDDVVSKLETSACIRCGKCGEGCPEHLLPAKLAGFAAKNDEAGFVKYDGMECVMCGSCSYVCPAKRPLTQQIKAMRSTVLANRKKK